MIYYMTIIKFVLCELFQVHNSLLYHFSIIQMPFNFVAMRIKELRVDSIGKRSVKDYTLYSQKVLMKYSTFNVL